MKKHRKAWQEVQDGGVEFSGPSCMSAGMSFSNILPLKWNGGDRRKQPVLIWGHSHSGSSLPLHTPVCSPTSKAATAPKLVLPREIRWCWRTYSPSQMMFFWEFNAQKFNRHSLVLGEFRSHHNLLEDRCIFILDSPNSIILAVHYQDYLRLILSTHV